MENRVAMMNIIAEDLSAIENINNVIHEYRLKEIDGVKVQTALSNS